MWYSLFRADSIVDFLIAYASGILLYSTEPDMGIKDVTIELS